jgi:hypothetical protein
MWKESSTMTSSQFQEWSKKREGAGQTGGSTEQNMGASQSHAAPASGAATVPAGEHLSNEAMDAQARDAFKRGLAERIRRLDEGELSRIRISLEHDQSVLRRLAESIAAGEEIHGGIATIREACEHAEQTVADLVRLLPMGGLDEFLASQYQRGVIARLYIKTEDIPQHDRERLGFASLPPVALREFERVFNACLEGQAASPAMVLGQSYETLRAIADALRGMQDVERGSVLPRVLLGLALLEAAHATAKDCEEYAKSTDLWRACMASLYFGGAFALVHLGVGVNDVGVAGLLRRKWNAVRAIWRQKRG